MATQSNNILVYNSGSVQKVNPADTISHDGTGSFNSFTVTGSMVSMSVGQRSIFNVSNNNLDLTVTGSNLTGTQILIDAKNSTGPAQVIAQSTNYTLIQAGSASEGYPYYLLLDANNKFVALEAEDVSGTIYIGAGSVASPIRIGSAGNRAITVGNTSSLTRINLNAGDGVYINGNYLSGTTLSGTFANHDPVTLGTANGLSLTDQVLSIATASAFNAGVVSTGSQYFSGYKAFASASAVYFFGADLDSRLNIPFVTASSGLYVAGDAIVYGNILCSTVTASYYKADAINCVSYSGPSEISLPTQFISNMGAGDAYAGSTSAYYGADPLFLITTPSSSTNAANYQPWLRIGYGVSSSYFEVDYLGRPECLLNASSQGGFILRDELGGRWLVSIDSLGALSTAQILSL